MKIQNATDVLLETYNAHGFYEGFTVTKEPTSRRDSYLIKAVAYCVNPMNCAPSEAENVRALLYYAKTGRDVFEGVNIPGMASIR